MARDHDEQHTLLDPADVYFTFSRIRPRFSCGRRVVDTLAQLASGALCVHDLPLLCVLTDGSSYYSLNNRRLYVYKALRARGVLTHVPVRLRPLPRTRRMAGKYTPDKCSRSATLMRERDDTDADATTTSDAVHSDADDDGDDEAAAAVVCSKAQQQQPRDAATTMTTVTTRQQQVRTRRSARQRRPAQRRSDSDDDDDSDDDSNGASTCSLARELQRLHVHTS